MEQLIDGTYDDAHTGIFRELYNSLLNGVEGNRPDVYFVLKDFADYRKAQEKISKDYKDQKSWIRKSLINIANGGKFSSDRTILDYAENIWDIKQNLPRNYIKE